MCARGAILYEAETLDYESPALTAELQARSDQKVKHSKPQVTNPECIQTRNESARIWKIFEKRFRPRICSPSLLIHLGAQRKAKAVIWLSGAQNKFRIAECALRI